MMADFATPDELDIRGLSVGEMMKRMAAIVMAVAARARQRRDERRLMKCHEMSRDLPVARDDLRTALMSLGTRA